MIKINLPNPTDDIKNYSAEVLPKVLPRLENLKLSLNHILNPPANVPKGIASFGPITRDAIRIIEDKKQMAGHKYDKKNYHATLSAYKAGVNHVPTVNIPEVLDLLNILTSNKGRALSKILTCKPEKLLQLDIAIKKKYLIGLKEKKLLKLAFNYTRFGEVADTIRSVFNDLNFVRVCPYCNLEKSTVLIAGGKRKVTGHQLDHFFCKKKHPLLAYCIFNLVPSGEKCNGSNLKWKNSFKDKYHLNPYIAGFNHSARFVPTVVKHEVIKIEVCSDKCLSTPLLHQLFGSGGIVNELHFEGNVNVFALESRYNDEKHHAARILRHIKEANSNLRSTVKYLNMIHSDTNRANAHKLWYDRLIGTPFEQKDLGTDIMSKFFRDIHDNYYFNDKKLYNNIVRRMIIYKEG